MTNAVLRRVAVRRLALCLLLTLTVRMTPGPADAAPASRPQSGQSSEPVAVQESSPGTVLPDLRAMAPMIERGIDAWRKASDAGRERIANLGAPLLARWIAAARTESLASGAQPMPPKIRAAIAGSASPALMDRVRYRVGWPESQGVHREVFDLLQTRAITLDDMIVFRDKDIAADPAIWVHELQHVQQYQRWGIEEFARRYLRHPDDIETEAWTATARYRMWALEGRPPAQSGPAPRTDR